MQKCGRCGQQRTCTAKGICYDCLEAALAEARAEINGLRMKVSEDKEYCSSHGGCAKLAAAQTANEAISKKNDGYRARIASLDGTVANLNRQLASEVAENARLKAERCIWDECECRTTGYEDEGIGNGPPDNDAEPARPSAPDPRDEEIARLKALLPPGTVGYAQNTDGRYPARPIPIVEPARPDADGSLYQHLKRKGGPAIAVVDTEPLKRKRRRSK